MTLEKAIEHAERAYKESRNGLQYALKRRETKFAERCKKDAEEYGQLAEWLRELQERRKEPEIVRCGECRHKGTHNCIANILATIYGYEVKDDFFCGIAEKNHVENG